MAKDSGESVEETRRRLELGAAGAAAAGASPAAPGEPAPRRRSLAPVLVIAGTAVVVLIIIAVIVLARGAGGGGGGGGLFSNPWSQYPGSRYTDAREILASPSREEVVADIDGFIAEFKERVAERYDVVWVVPYGYDQPLERADNGYDGESMLYDYRTDEWNGAAVADDPGARKWVTDLFFELAADHGLADVYIGNDDYMDAEDRERALEWYGATVRSQQARWDASAYDFERGSLPSLRMEVYDASMPVDETFRGWNGLGEVEIDGQPATLFFSIGGSASDLLAEADRDAFIERLRDYDENDKP